MLVKFFMLKHLNFDITWTTLHAGFCFYESKLNKIEAYIYTSVSIIIIINIPYSCSDTIKANTHERVYLPLCRVSHITRIRITFNEIVFNICEISK